MPRIPRPYAYQPSQHPFHRLCLRVFSCISWFPSFQNRHGNYQVVIVSRIDRIPQLDRYSDINYQWVLEKVRTKKHKKHLKKDKESIKTIVLNIIIQQRKKDA